MSAATTTTGGIAPRGPVGRRRVAGRLAAAIVAVAACASLAQVAEAKLDPPAVPSRLEVQAGNKLFLVGHAIGVQIYSCNAAGAGFAWGLVAPRANLYDDHGKLIVTHDAGPTWEAKDGSRIAGQRVDGVTVDSTAIPWLLVSARSVGEHGGRLARTTFIQRIATTGGLAPAAAECNAATVGTRQEVAYTADYYFWKQQGS